MIIVRAFRRKGPNNDSDGEWISHAMKAAKITADAAKMIPVAGPFIEAGANIFCDILEPLQGINSEPHDIPQNLAASCIGGTTVATF
ncbi:hypothetical protein M422DRAFT_254716 [Sphaerobolus stellatus SS14]|uniref:Uncharacterized protein n=1 Tax=Sphaerobolus stellatus (strain SS14) TaxID=990650 RepID=A0A0C9VUQ8_SPHS4|nr:hypothetical protein M422DRAFT_254716 [Sphaerobolus stellatus SS14]